jgi:uncharacterized membrane protein
MRKKDPAGPTCSDGSIRQVSEEISVDAPVGRLWSILTDVDQMPGVQPQMLSARWLGGASEAALGARFASENIHEGGVWQATSRIVEFRPGHSIAWTVEGAAAPPTVCRFDLIADPDPSVDRVVLRQTYFFDTRAGATPPIECATSR